MGDGKLRGFGGGGRWVGSGKRLEGGVMWENNGERLGEWEGKWGNKKGKQEVERER